MSTPLTIPASHPLFAIISALAALPSLTHERTTKDGANDVHVTGKLDLPGGRRFYGSLYVPTEEKTPAKAAAPKVRKGAAKGAKVQEAAPEAVPMEAVTLPDGRTAYVPRATAPVSSTVAPAKVVSADGGTAQPGKARKAKAPKATPAATQAPAVAEPAPTLTPASPVETALAKLLGAVERIDARVTAMEKQG